MPAYCAQPEPVRRYARPAPQLTGCQYGPWPGARALPRRA